MAAKIERLKEDMLINEFLTAQTNRQKISKDKLEAVYTKNISQFLIEENEYKYQLIYFDRKDDANKVYSVMKENKIYNPLNLDSDLSALIVHTDQPRRNLRIVQNMGQCIKLANLRSHLF